tara:strand:+ start:164 stop:406 length:243 start_codon:yes stop_codon:yes gene_type:complete
MTEHTDLINEAILHFEREEKEKGAVALEGVWWEGKPSCRCYFKDDSFEIWTIKRTLLGKRKLFCVKKRTEERDRSWRVLT